MTSKITDFLLFGIGLLQIFESEAGPYLGAPPGYAPYKTCFDINETLAKEMNSIGKEAAEAKGPEAKCAFHAYWARETGSQDASLQEWYHHFKNLSGLQDISAYQCMLFQKHTYPPWTEKESHNCSFPCKGIYLLHDGPNEKKYHNVDSEVICKGFPAKGDTCVWSDWSACSAGAQGVRTRNVTGYNEGCLLTGSDGTLMDIGPCVAAKKDAPNLWWLWVLLLAVCVALGVLAYFLCKKEPKPVRKKRVMEKVVIEEPKPELVPVRTTSYVLTPVTTVMKPVTKKVQKQVARVVYDTVEELVTENVPVTTAPMTTAQPVTTATTAMPAASMSYAAPIASPSVSYAAPGSVSYAAPIATMSMPVPAGSMSIQAPATTSFVHRPY